MTEIYTLFSGSSGNSALIRTDNNAVLIDAGCSMKKIECSLKELGLSIDDLDAIFASHEHIDHVAAIPMIAKHHNVPIYLPEKSVFALRGIDNVNALPELNSVIRFGDIAVDYFRTPHDSASSVGFVINTPDGKYGLATDMGMVMKSVADRLTGCNAAIIEANYDSFMLENGSYPRALKDRIASGRGHLDNRDSAKLVAYLALNGTAKFLLAHLSKENNTPEKALSCVKDFLSRNGITAEVSVASRDRITRFI